MKNKEFTDAELLFATLIASGQSERNINRFLKKVFNEDIYKNKDCVTAYKCRQVVETLSHSWIIEQLRDIALGDDKTAAVAALNVLQRMNEKYFHSIL
ncbi:hypothetical protein DUQ17_22255 [Salmonella enterica subsp. diarizonae]|nr:hypothetical protein [Salmonella enterica subsp. diarizonae]